MSYAANASNLETASERFIGLASQLRDAVQTGRDSVESASKVSALAAQFALASVDFIESLSIVHSDNLAIVGETPCENADDFADWTRRVAHSRTYALFDGFRSPARFIDLRPSSEAVDLRPMLAAE